jgi:SAM-dependent methyltransferase
MQRAESYGQRGLTFVDRLGVWLSYRAVNRFLPRRNGLEVLELGCGYHAGHLTALRPRLKRGIGVDIKIAPHLHDVEHLTLHEGSIEEILPRLQEERLDAILLISVLEHLREPLFTLESIWQLLKPSGVLLVNVPTWLGKFFLEFSAFRLGLSPKFEIDDHKMYYNKRDLWPLLIRSGFKPSQVKLYYHKFGLNLFATAMK